MPHLTEKVDSPEAAQILKTRLRGLVPHHLGTEAPVRFVRLGTSRGQNVTRSPGFPESPSPALLAPNPCPRTGRASRPVGSRSCFIAIAIKAGFGASDSGGYASLSLKRQGSHVLPLGCSWSGVGSS